MFDAAEPLYLRGLSLYHIVLSPLLTWLIWRLGYDPRAWRAQTLFGWAVLVLVYFTTDPGENIYWVFGPGESPQDRIPPWMYLLLVMFGFPVVVYMPTHLLLRRYLRR